MGEARALASSVRGQGLETGHLALRWAHPAGHKRTTGQSSTPLDPQQPQVWGGTMGNQLIKISLYFPLRFLAVRSCSHDQSDLQARQGHSSVGIHATKVKHSQRQQHPQNRSRWKVIPQIWDANDFLKENLENCLHFTEVYHIWEYKMTCVLIL